MATKKAELYSFLENLRGGMGAAGLPVPMLIFIKYTSDKYKGHGNAIIDVPPVANFPYGLYLQHISITINGFSSFMVQGKAD